jgi:hypothetical protein
MCVLMSLSVWGQIALIMVGLPARGKTHTAQKLNRYLRWLGHNSQIFDVGHYRRGVLGAQPSAAFFDHGPPPAPLPCAGAGAGAYTHTCACAGACACSYTHACVCACACPFNHTRHVPVPVPTRVLCLCLCATDNKDAAEARMRVARLALKDMLAYFGAGGQVGIYDATNTTEAVRSFLLAELAARGASV